jgi:hypothetical protein
MVIEGRRKITNLSYKTLKHQQKAISKLQISATKPLKGLRKITNIRNKTLKATIFRKNRRDPTIQKVLIITRVYIGIIKMYVFNLKNTRIGGEAWRMYAVPMNLSS